ncbi:MAG TPA: hypothetical protein VE133_19170 [Candidatus Sulfotelmatobacter sp.]|nr:hypothetical protein [Candidatus Sulfotelmatobacter sp.]
MDADLKKRLGITLAIFVVAGAVEVGYLKWSRRDTGTPPKKNEPTYSTNQDDYVTTHKIFPFNVESAKKELVGKPVWAKTGNQIPYYRYDAPGVNFSRQAGLLPPVAKLQVKDVVLQRQPVALKPGQVAVVQKQIMLVFEKTGTPGLFAASIGTNTGDDYTFNANDLLFFDDPHELYKHWPPDIWSAIDQHQVKEGMSELQASFAVGGNGSSDSDKPGDRTIEYSNAGNPVTVTFEKNKAVKVTPGKAQ